MSAFAIEMTDEGGKETFTAQRRYERFLHYLSEAAELTPGKNQEWKWEKVEQWVGWRNHGGHTKEETIQQETQKTEEDKRNVSRKGKRYGEKEVVRVHGKKENSAGTSEKKSTEERGNILVEVRSKGVFYSTPFWLRTKRQ